MSYLLSKMQYKNDGLVRFILVTLFLMLIITLVVVVITASIWSDGYDANWTREGQSLAEIIDRPLEEEQAQGQDGLDGSPARSSGGAEPSILPSPTLVKARDGLSVESEVDLDDKASQQVASTSRDVGTDEHMSDSLSELNRAIESLIEAIHKGNDKNLYAMLSSQLRLIFSEVDVRQSMQMAESIRLEIDGQPAFVTEGLAQQRLMGQVQGQMMIYELVMQREVDGWRLAGFVE